MSESLIIYPIGFVQNGNSFGVPAVLGTNDNFSLSFETNGQTYTTISNTGRLTHVRGTSLETLDSGGFQEDAFLLSDRRFNVDNNVVSVFVAPALRANGIGFSDLNWTTPNNATSSLGNYIFSSLRTKVGLTNNALTFGSNTNTSYAGTLSNFEITNYDGLTTTGYLAGIKSVLSRSGTANGSLSNFSDILVGASNGQGDGTGIVITNRRAIHIVDMNSIWPTSITNKWGVYQEGTTTNNVYAGKSGFGALTAPTSIMHLSTTALNTTPTIASGLFLANTTAAAVNSQQISPVLTFRGNGWRTNATAQSETVDFSWYNLPVQGAADPTGTLILKASINGGAYNTNPIFSITSSDAQYVFGSSGLAITASSGAAGGLSFNGSVQSNSIVSGSSSLSMFQTGTLTNGQFGIRLSGTSATVLTSGNVDFLESSASFTPTSGTATYQQILIRPTINQTGGANGISRGVYINAVITAAADYRALEIGTGKSIFNGSIFAGGTTSPTAYLHLAAGTTAASTGPLKFTSGTNMTTAEAGTMEYNGTNLFFTRAGTTRENVLIAVDNASAPSTTAAGTVTNRYGGATNFLGDPNRWLSVNVLGTVYKIPLYT